MEKVYEKVSETEGRVVVTSATTVALTEMTEKLVKLQRALEEVNAQVEGETARWNETLAVQNARKADLAGAILIVETDLAGLKGVGIKEEAKVAEDEVQDEVTK